MQIKQHLESTKKKLKESLIPTYNLDAELLMSEVIGKDRAWILTHHDHTLTIQQIENLNSLLERRVQHEPIAYILGKQEFYGREFQVSPDTLTPRPETETMIELLLKLFHNPKSTIQDPVLVDVGTGSGCIIITALLELSKIQKPLYLIQPTGLDISEPALEIARKNASKHKVDIDFHYFDLNKDALSSLLTPHSSQSSKIQDPRSIIYLCNLPYVPNDFKINLAATHEPPFAIFGGLDGLDYYRQLFLQLSTIHNPRSKIQYVFTETLPPQHKALKEIAESSGFEQIDHQDFIQVFKK